MASKLWTRMERGILVSIHDPYRRFSTFWLSKICDFTKKISHLRQPLNNRLTFSSEYHHLLFYSTARIYTFWIIRYHIWIYFRDTCISSIFSNCFLSKNEISQIIGEIVSCNILVWIFPSCILFAAAIHQLWFSKGGHLIHSSVFSTLIMSDNSLKRLYQRRAVIFLYLTCRLDFPAIQSSAFSARDASAISWKCHQLLGSCDGCGECDVINFVMTSVKDQRLPFD